MYEYAHLDHFLEKITSPVSASVCCSVYLWIRSFQDGAGDGALALDKRGAFKMATVRDHQITTRRARFFPCIGTAFFFFFFSISLYFIKTLQRERIQNSSTSLYV